MGSRKKIYIYALFLIACLICAITFLFINLSDNNNNKEFEFQGENLSVYDGIPSDAVAILDIKKIDTYAKLSKDTTSVIYDFIDRGNRNITLRPEGTAGVVRSFIENKM